MKYSLTVIFCSILSFSACSSGDAVADIPPADVAKKEFLASDIYRREISEGIARLREFEKTNGQLGEIGGVRIYTLFYEAEIEYVKDDPKLKDVFGGYTNNRLNEVLLRCRLDETKSGPRCRDRKAGDIAVISGELIFEETENGWVKSSASITGSTEADTSRGRKLTEEPPASDFGASSSRRSEQGQGRSLVANPSNQGLPDTEQLKDEIVGAWGAADEGKRVALVFADNGELTMFRAIDGEAPATKKSQYRIAHSGNLEIHPYLENGSLGDPQSQELRFEGDSLTIGIDNKFHRIGNLDDFLNFGGSRTPERQRSRNPVTAGSVSSGLVLLYSVPPEYPPRAKSRGLEGTVQVQFSLSANGKPTDAIIVTSSSSIFERAAIAHILERRYEPPGRAIAGLREEILFKLD